MSELVILLNFDKKSTAKFESSLKQLGADLETYNVESPEEIEALNRKALCVFYVNSGKCEKLQNTVNSIREAQRNIPINVIFKKRDFDSLLCTVDLKIADVLDKRYTPGDLRRALERSELRSAQMGDSQLPIEALMELLSSPIKVKSDRDLYRQLYSYFKSFPESIEFALYRVSEAEEELVQGPDIASKNMINSIREFNLPKIFIGKHFDSKCPDGKEWQAFPVFEIEGVETWCLCSISNNRKDYVLNNVFFRYLENILIFRKNLERVSSYLDLANKDDVTGLFNQRKLVADLAETIEYHEATEKTFSIMFIDVDHFKKVNDNFGHIVGSQMLTEIGQELRNVLRSSDKIYRYGGDEFVVLMPEVKIDLVHKIAVRVRETVKQKYFNVGEAKDYQLSLSIGIAEYPSDAKTAKDIVNFADSMMYVSKKSGRGKVFHVGEVQDDPSDTE